MQDKTESTPETQQFGSVRVALKGKPTFDVKVFPNDLTDRYTVQVKYYVPEPPKEVEQPVDYVFCVDVSGSMGWTVDDKEPENETQETKIDLVHGAILSFVQKHGKPGDTFSMVTFDTMGRQLISSCTKEEFLSKAASERDTLKRMVKVNKGTAMQSAFNAIDAKQFAQSENKRTLILLTDGDDSKGHKTVPAAAAKTIHHKCGADAQLLVASIGESPNLDALRGLLKATDSALPYPSHISKSEQVETRVDFLAEFIGGEKVADLNFGIKIGQYKKEFNKLITNYNNLYSIQFEVNKAELMEGDALVSKAQISCSYGPHNKDLTPVIVPSSEVKYIEQNDHRFSKESDQAFIKGVYLCLNKIMEDELVKELCDKTRLNLLDTLKEDQKARVREYFTELTDLQEAAKNKVTEKNADYYDAMNDINEMLRILATHLRWKQMYTPEELIVDGTITNAFKSKTATTTNLPPDMLKKYNKGARTAHGEGELLKGLADDSYEIDPRDGRLILKLSGAKGAVERYKLVDSGLDFVRAFKQGMSLAYADGDPKKREIILNERHGLFNSDYDMHELLNIDLDDEGLEKLRKFSKDFLRSPDEEERVSAQQVTDKKIKDKPWSNRERFNMAVFYNARLLKLKNDSEIPASKLSNFIDQRIGLCRHHAMFIASILAMAIIDKGAKGEVNLIRTTAFNYNAHAYVVYKTKEAFMLIDPVLDRNYDLKQPGELAKASADYQRKGLPGILLSLIQRESGYTLCKMKPDTEIEDNKLYIKIEGDSLQYKVKHPFGKKVIVASEIKLSDINSKLAELKNPPTLADLEPFLPKILKITSALGHTREGLDPDYKVREGDSFDIPLFDPALLASLKADENIAFADLVCAIGLQIPSDPVRPILWNEQEGKEVVSKHVYERAELMEWLENSDTDPQTRARIVRIPEADEEICKQCRREIHELISHHYQCIKTEDLMSEETSIQESDERKNQRKGRWEAKKVEQGIAKPTVDNDTAATSDLSGAAKDSSKKGPFASLMEERRKLIAKEKQRAEEAKQGAEEEKQRPLATGNPLSFANSQTTTIAPEVEEEKTYREGSSSKPGVGKQAQQNLSNEPITNLERAKNLLEQNRGAVAQKILASMLRLEHGRDNYWNPYWMNSGTKLEGIINAVLATEHESNSLEELMADQESALYSALNMLRLAQVTFLGRLGFNKAKSVMAVEDELPNAPTNN